MSKEIDHDAQIARDLGPPPDEHSAITSWRTPRWIWAWMIPVLLLVLLIMARRVLGPFVIAGMLAYIFSMVVDQIQERLHWPRALAVTGLYVIFLGALGILLYFGVETLYQQTRAFLSDGPRILEDTFSKILPAGFTFGGQTLDAHTLAQRVNDGLANYFGNGDAAALAGEIVGRLLDSFLVLIITFYLLMDGKRLGAYLLKYVPSGSRARTGYIAGRIHTVLGAYLRGQLLLILLMSVMSFILLQFVFGVKFALPIAIITGFLEILPFIGPAMATALAAGIAFSDKGAQTALFVVIAYFILRQLEDNLVMPFVVGRAVELHPVATIFAVLAGGAMFGTLGMLLAVPAAAAIKIVLDFLYPTDPDRALAQARPGMRRAAEEAEERDEPAPSEPASAAPP